MKQMKIDSPFQVLQDQNYKVFEERVETLCGLKASAPVI